MPAAGHMPASKQGKPVDEISTAAPVRAKRSPAGALGEAIRSARREQGDAQEAFAACVGLDRSYFGAIERGEFNITLATLLKITAGLGIRASSLLRRAEL
jgi:XRE family transcriptional regulator, regulator of sulfur utilization